MTDDRYEYVGKPVHGTIVGRSTQSAWDLAATGRANILRLVHDGRTKRRGILGVFGVGDGSSLDLKRLLDRFHEVHLIDRDEQSIKQAIQSQNLEDRQRIFHKAIDISGVHDLLARHATQPSSDGLEEIYKTVDEYSMVGLPKFDVVLSMYQIPELTLHAARCITDDPILLTKIISRLRSRHVEILLDHLVDPGNAILVIDIVSSETLPALAMSPGDLRQLLEHAVSTGNFFPGALPVTVNQTIDEFADRFSHANVSTTWIRQTTEGHRACVAWRIQVETPER